MTSLKILTILYIIEKNYCIISTLLLITLFFSSYSGTCIPDVQLHPWREIVPERR